MAKNAPSLDFILGGRLIIVGYNSEQKRWAIRRERTFTALLWWPLIIGIGRKDK